MSIDAIDGSLFNDFNRVFLDRGMITSKSKYHLYVANSLSHLRNLLQCTQCREDRN